MCDWCSQINLPSFSDMPITAKDIHNMCTVLLQGIALASQVKILTDDLLLLHYTENISMNEDLLVPFLSGMSIIKGVDLEISTKITQIALMIPVIKRSVQDQMLGIWKIGLSEIEKIVKSEWKDFLHFVFITASESARGTLNYSRLKFINLLYPVLSLKELVKADNQPSLKDCFQKMNLLSEFERTLYNVTHLNYFYKIRKYASVFFKLILEQKTSFHFMKYLFRVFEDSRRLLNKVAYLEEKDQLMKQYKKEIMTTFTKEIIDPVVNKVSNSLRLKIHTYYIDKIKAENPLKEETLDIKNIVSCESLFLFGERINIKAIIEEEMTKQFYDISAFNPNDWQTYEDMKTLAYNLFGLELKDNLLPPQKLGQGMDIIAIVKEIRDFVPNYHFSIHTQVTY
jgi:WASH complex subunit 7